MHTTVSKDGRHSPDTKRQKRTPEGKEGAGAHQEGRGAIQAGQTNRRAKKAPQNGSGAQNYEPKNR